MDYSQYEALKVDLENGLIRISINRPEALNAINEQLHNELTDVISKIDRDRNVDVAILTSEGRAFCAGGDLNWLLRIHGNAAEASELIRNDRRLQTAFLELEKPIIARVTGAAVGLGCSLALYCDFVYADPSARFADPHVSVGLVAGDGGAVLWPQLVGPIRAKRYLLTGDAIKAEDAADMGLITEVVPAEELDATVNTMAERLLKGPKHAIRFTKASVNAGLKQVANAIMDRAAAYECVTQMTDDHKIALEAFIERKDPEFIGS